MNSRASRRNDPNGSNKENNDTKRKVDALEGELQELKGAVKEFGKKQLTEEEVRGWLKAALTEHNKEAQGRSAKPQGAGTSTGGYRSLQHLESCSMARLNLEA